MNNFYFKATNRRGWLLALCVWLAMVDNVPARTMPDAGDPVGFFTTVADKLLRSTFSFGVTNIPVCSNGIFVYSPAVQRILQLSANVYDAANTNFFPTVFRPCFSSDTNGNLFITGYTNVDSVTGLDDPRLAAPLDVSAVLPSGGTNVFVNVYGVPWIIGAKKGLPNFNQFSMVNAVQVTRMLQVSRNSTNAFAATYWTNQMYVISITNNLGLSLWNSYSNDYPRPLTVYASDWIQMTLTDAVNTWVRNDNFTTPSVTINAWLGSHWGADRTLPPNQAPNPGSFYFTNWTFTFLPQSIYRFGTASFDPVRSGTNAWETTTPPLPQLPQFGLNTTNYLQAVILDGSNVIDYVQLRGPVSSRNLNQELADPNFPDMNYPNVFLMWSTNAFNPSDPDSPAYGVMNQLAVSGYPFLAPPGNYWAIPVGFPNNLPPTVDAIAAYFSAFFYPGFQYNGQNYVNTQLTILAPYMPRRTLYEYTLWQVNDPLVHYLASDLSYLAPSYIGLHKSDDPAASPLPITQQSAKGIHYQPWGLNRQLAGLANVDANAYNLAYKDPLVWGSDNWNFPTNLLTSLGGLGQVHRGTPWQTVYLKSPNVLQETSTFSNQTGTNTWMQWTGNSDAHDASLMAPVNDWRLAGMLMSLLNTNDATHLLSVNDPNTADWLNVLNGLTVYSNSIAVPHAGITPIFDTYVMASNSAAALVVANGIAQARAGQPNQIYYFVGDVLAAPELTENSPWLNTGTINQVEYGITDAAYEAIPAQLLPLLRPDSIGILTPTNGGWDVWFSGADGYAYVVQTSTNLVNWEVVNTNNPVQGSFMVPIPAMSNSPKRFYRSVLLP